MSYLVSLFDLLTPRQRVQLALLASAMLVTALLEMLSVASVLPFVTVAANPDQIASNRWLAWAYGSLGFTTANGFLVTLGAASLLALLVSNAWMATTTWAQARFAASWNRGVSVRLLHHYLAKPYVFFLRHNGADLSKNILDEVREISQDIIAPGLRVCAKGVASLSIVGLLVALEPILALVVAGTLAGAYATMYVHLRRRMQQTGLQRLKTNTARFKVVSEAFGAIKDLKLMGREAEPVARFDIAARRHARSVATAAIAAELPRYALDVVAFGSVLAAVIYLLLSGQGLQQAIPFLGLYVFAGYRLMPSLQQVFQGYTRLRFGSAALANLHQELVDAGRTSGSPEAMGPRGRPEEALPFADRLELDHVTFAYPGAPRPTLHDVTLAIAVRTTVGLTGPTGAGKTTLVDVILGLLRPQAGEIRIDGRLLTDDGLRAWQNGIGYVPQHIYLSDDTIARNIAFAIPAAEIDQGEVERAARIAHIHEFVTQDLPDGYGTVVGERGIRLSGGQRQRLGIARALYHDPSVLVLDEATNALDHDTEAAIMDALDELAGTRTILIIAHRSTSLHLCDSHIRVIGDGRVVAEPAPTSATRREDRRLVQEHSDR